MRSVLAAAGLAALAMPAAASDTGDAIAAAAYEGTLGAKRGELATACDSGDTEACFGAGLGELVATYESLAQATYRHGGVFPNENPASIFFGFGLDEQAKPANPKPEPLSYDQLRTILDDAVKGLDRSRDLFAKAGDSGDYVILLDPLRLRLDVDGDGTVAEGETFAPFWREMQGLSAMELNDKQKSKGVEAVPDGTIGFDRADAYWFAGYTQVTATPFDFLLAHDFSGLFNAYFHRLFPEAGLPMQGRDGDTGATDAFLGGGSDASLADMVVALHELNFPVADPDRLKGVLVRLKSVTAFSRQNWQAIAAETDDNRELLPSPRQTSLVPGFDVTEEVVAAWMETLDTVDTILNGDLLIPHWRFDQGFNLKTYFDTATRTDLVMLLTGYGALPFLDDGPIADADDFAKGNAVFGDNWPNFIVWFN